VINGDLYIKTAMHPGGRSKANKYCGMQGNELFRSLKRCKSRDVESVEHNLTCVQIRAAKSENCVNCKGTREQREARQKVMKDYSC